MRIIVCTKDDIEADEYPDVKGWHVDNNHFLHVLKPSGSGNLATYTPGHWVSVHEESDEPTLADI